MPTTFLLTLLTEIVFLFHYLYKLPSGGVHRTKQLSKNTEGTDRVDGMCVCVMVILMWLVLNKRGGIV